ncbi:MAG: anhydro-N-acetylmuramic acid kinase [Alphaproteobacteria bacterium]|nr:anhydro-N-acetylmuramic acid kinase [Alphaproteobacteria bacterium]
MSPPSAFTARRCFTARPHQDCLTHRQLGDGRAMADRLGIAVVNDFRSADMAAGGKGAPLSAIYHAALLKPDRRGSVDRRAQSRRCHNITFVDADGRPLAFDTGPPMRR